MKRLQKIILAIGLALIAADCLFPPYVTLFEVNGEQVGPTFIHDRAFLLTKGFNRSDADMERKLGIKTPSREAEVHFTRINYRQLGLQVLIIALVTMATFLVVTLISRHRAARSALAMH